MTFQESNKPKNQNKIIALSSKGQKYEFDFREDGSIRYKNKLIEVEIIEKDGFTFIEYNKKRYPVELLESNQNRYEVLINQLAYIFTVETPFSYKRKNFLTKQVVATRNETVTAPLPGKIIEIAIEEGQQMKEGDTILILEAMKMQNEITSHVSGRVKKILVKKGDTVMKDDVLVELER